MKKTFKRIFTLLLMVTTGTSWAQTAGQPVVYSLQECLEYAYQHSEVVQNAVLDTRIAQEKVGETKSAGLPQVNANVNYTYNFRVQKTILENGIVPLFTVPSEPLGGVLAFPFFLKNQFVPSLTVNQLLFDESFFTGLKASRVYQEQAQQKLKESKINVAERVMKSYYAVLVNQKQVDFLDSNLPRVDSLFRDAQAKLRSGLNRKIDVDRIEVRLNNLKEERRKAVRLLELAKAALRFEMNLPNDAAIALTDSLNENLLPLETEASESASLNVNNRIEYQLLQTQQRLNEFNIRNIRAGFYPRLLLSGTTGYNPAATHIGDIFQNQRWLNYTYVGLQLQIPIFDGYGKRHRLSQARFESEKIENNLRREAKGISLEVQQAEITLANSLESLRTQRRNLELSQENVRIIRLENEKGVALNIEVTNAENDLNEAQNNYYNALYNALVAKIDLDKASGKLGQ